MIRQLIIRTPAIDVNRHLDFYSKLGFTQIPYNEGVYVTDGKVLIEICTEKFIRGGFTLCVENLQKAVYSLEDLVPVLDIPEGKLISHPCGTWIYLTEYNLPFQYESRDKPYGVPGNYMGLSMELQDMQKAARIWESLGAGQIDGSMEKGYITFDVPGGPVSIMKPFTCPHLFFNPSLTYFNGSDNEQIIDRIRKSGIPIEEEITIFNPNNLVDNIIIRDPAGYGFFIFSD